MLDSIVRKIFSWHVYFIAELLFETLCVLKGIGSERLVHVIPFIIYFVLCDFDQNITAAREFLAKYYAFVLWTVVVFIIHLDIIYDANSFLYLHMIPYLFAGYRVAQCENKDAEPYGFAIPAIMVLTPIILISLILYMMHVNPVAELAVTYYNEQASTRLTTIFAHPLPAACVIGTYSLLCMFCIKHKYLRIILTALGLISLFFTGSRSTLIPFVFVLLLYLLVEIYKSNGSKRINIMKPRAIFKILIIVAILVTGFALACRYMELLPQQLSDILIRFDISTFKYQYRLIAWKTMITEVWPASWLIIKLFGGGFLSHMPAMSPVVTKYSSSIYAQWGTVDNAYLAGLYDYGIFYEIMLLIALGKTVKMMFSNSRIKRQVASMELILFGAAAFFEIYNWSYCMFMLLFLYGYLNEITPQKGQL